MKPRNAKGLRQLCERCEEFRAAKSGQIWPKSAEKGNGGGQGSAKFDAKFALKRSIVCEFTAKLARERLAYLADHIFDVAAHRQGSHHQSDLSASGIDRRPVGEHVAFAQ